jgi:predicted amidohydrolase
MSSAAFAPFTVACLQTNASRDVAANLATVGRLARAAKDQGADFVLAPEYVALFEPDAAALLKAAEPWEGHSQVAAFATLARELRVWMLAGSLHVKAPSGKAFNRSILFDDSGRIVAHYDKIHLFDVTLANGERYRESDTFEAGAAARIADTPWGPIGFSVCYDVRFPHLYRALAQGGARTIVVPSAFTRATGEKHWHVLLRARAIETGAFVVAPAQTGTHAEGRKTFGHSLVVDPWGNVLADGGEEVGVVTARIDPDLVDRARAQVPAWGKDAAFKAAAPAVRA